MSKRYGILMASLAFLGCGNQVVVNSPGASPTSAPTTQIHAPIATAPGATATSDDNRTFERAPEASPAPAGPQSSTGRGQNDIIKILQDSARLQKWLQTITLPPIDKAKLIDDVEQLIVALSHVGRFVCSDVEERLGRVLENGSIKDPEAKKIVSHARTAAALCRDYSVAGPPSR